MLKKFYYYFFFFLIKRKIHLVFNLFNSTIIKSDLVLYILYAEKRIKLNHFRGSIMGEKYLLRDGENCEDLNWFSFEDILVNNNVLELKAKSRINTFLSNFDLYKLHPNGFFSYYYYTEIILKKRRSFLLSTFFLKKNLYYVLNVLTFLNFLNAIPLMLASKANKIFEDLQSFTLLFPFRKFNYVIAFDLDMIHKYIFTILKLSLPVFSIISKETNVSIVDYPLIVRDINDISVYIFFSFFFDCFLSGQYLRSDFLKRSYISSKILIFLKKQLIRYK